MKIKWNWNGQTIKASPWSGEYEGIKYPGEDYTKYMQATDGTIYYRHGDGWNVWCIATRLRRHLILLNQIASRQ